jgi:hypothetical protein
VHSGLLRLLLARSFGVQLTPSVRPAISLKRKAARSNADARAEYRRLHPTQEDLEWATNVAKNATALKPWPEASQRTETLTHCAEVLRTAIDTNQIGMACDKMTNQPEKMIALRELCGEVMSNLDLMADYLADPDLATSLGDAGYQAGIQVSSSPLRFGFWSESRLPTLVLDFDERTPDSQHVILRARFYENGKLLEVDENGFDSKGRFQSKDVLVFEEDGNLRTFWVRPTELEH